MLVMALALDRGESQAGNALWCLHLVFGHFFCSIKVAQVRKEYATI